MLNHKYWIYVELNYFNSIFELNWIKSNLYRRIILIWYSNCWITNIGYTLNRIILIQYFFIFYILNWIKSNFYRRIILIWYSNCWITNIGYMSNRIILIQYLNWIELNLYRRIILIWYSNCWIINIIYVESNPIEFRKNIFLNYFNSIFELNRIFTEELF